MSGTGFEVLRDRSEDIEVGVQRDIGGDPKERNEDCIPIISLDAAGLQIHEIAEGRKTSIGGGDLKKEDLIST